MTIPNQGTCKHQIAKAIFDHRALTSDQVHTFAAPFNGKTIDRNLHELVESHLVEVNGAGPQCLYAPSAALRRHFDKLAALRNPAMREVTPSRTPIPFSPLKKSNMASAEGKREGSNEFRSFRSKQL